MLRDIVGPILGVVRHLALVCLALVLIQAPAQATVGITQAPTPNVVSAGVATPIAFAVTLVNADNNGFNFTVSDLLPPYVGNVITNPKIQVFNSGSTTPASTNTSAPTVTAVGSQYRLTWSGTTNVPSNGRLVLTFTATMNAPISGAYSNTATFTSSGTPTSNTSDSSGVITVGEPPALATVQTAPSGTVASGGNALCTLDITNSGNSSTSGLTIVDTMPAGFSYPLGQGRSKVNGVTIGDPAVSGQTLTWTVGTTTGLAELAANTTISLGVSLVAPGTTGYYSNAMGVSATNSQPPPQTLGSIRVGSANPVTITVGIGANSPYSGTSYTVNGNAGYGYGITVTNPNAYAVVVSKVYLRVPAGTDYSGGGTVTPATGCVGSCSQNPALSGDVYSWSVQNLPTTLGSGQSLKINVPMHVPYNTGGGTYNAYAWVETDRGGTVSVGPTAPLIVNGAILSVTKTVTYPATASVPTSGGYVRYAITITNTGTAGTGSLQVVDTLPTGWTHDTNGGSYNPNYWPSVSSNVLTWGGINVSAGNTVTITFQVKVPNGTAPGQYPSVVTVKDMSYANYQTLDSGPVAPVTVGGVAQLFLDKTASPTSVLAYQLVTYTLQLRNASTATATATVATLTDWLPTGFTYQSGTTEVSADGLAWTSKADPQIDPMGQPTGTLIWTLAGMPNVPMAADKALYLRFKVRVGDVPGSYSNSAVVKGSNFPNVSVGPTATVVVGNAPGLEVTKSVAQGANAFSSGNATVTMAAAGTVCYTIQVQNVGTVAAQGVTLQDALPAGFTYQSLSSAVSTNGTTYAASGEPAKSGSTLTWAGNYTIPGGGDLYLRFNATTPANGVFTNTAQAWGTNTSTSTSGPTAQVSVGIVPSISFPATTDTGGGAVPRVTPGTIDAGQTAVYTYAVKTTTAAASNIRMRAYLPNYLSLVAGQSKVSTNNGASWTTVGDADTTTFTVNWPVVLTSLSANSTMLFQFAVAADTTAPSNQYYTEVEAYGTNFAAVSVGSPPKDPFKTAAFSILATDTSIPVLIIQGASAVDLLSFTARADRSGVRLQWQTGSERQNLGYLLYRSDRPTGIRQPLTSALIGGLGNSERGGRYEFLDAAVPPGQSVTYWLEDREFGGQTQLHGPLTITVPTDGTTATAEWQLPTSAPAPAPTPWSTAAGPMPAAPPGLRVLDADDSGMTVELRTAAMDHVRRDGYSTIAIPGLGTLTRPGIARIPELVAGFGAPQDVPVTVSVLAADDAVVTAADPLAVTPGRGAGTTVTPSAEPSETPVTAETPASPAAALPARSSGTFTEAISPGTFAATRQTMTGAHLQFGFGLLQAAGPVPAELAVIGETARLRHERLLQVCLYPVRYDPQAGTVTHYRRLLVRVAFAGGTRLAPATTADAWQKAMQLLARDYHLLNRWTAAPIPVTDAYQRPAGPACRLTVGQSGMQRVPAQALRAAGFALTDPDRLYVRYRDREIPCEVQQEGAAIKAVVFAAEQVGDLYSRTSVYQVGEAPGGHARMAELASPATTGAPATTRLAVIPHERDTFYWANKPRDAHPEHWFWASIRSDANDQTFALTAPHPVTDAGVSAQLTVGLRGVRVPTAIRKSVTVFLNEQVIGELFLTDTGYLNTALGFDQSLLRPTGANDLRLQVADGVIVYLDRCEIRYTARNEATDGELTGVFPVEAGGTVQGTGLHGPTAAYDLTDPASPRRITGSRIAAGATVVARPAGTGPWRVRLVTADGYRTPQVRPWPQGDDLHGATDGADYLIITPASLRKAADKLALHRGAQGFQTRVVDVADIYTEFAGGHAEPEAIRRFLRWAVSNWPDPKPVYVVLLGDGHYDFRQDFAGSPPVPIPVLLRDNAAIGTIADENALAAVIGDDPLPDVMLGRLPVATADEAAALVDKLIAYDQTSGQPWRQRGLTVADAGTSLFAELADGVRRDFAPALSWTGFGSDQSEAVIDRLSSGNHLVVYVGHGYAEGWSSRQTFSIWRAPGGANDLDRLAADGATGFWVTANCLNGYFHDPLYPCLGESVLRAPGKGAVAFWGTDGYTMPEAQAQMTRRFLGHLLADRVDVGTAALLSRLGLFLDGGAFWEDELSAWVLLGEPCPQAAGRSTSMMGRRVRTSSQRTWFGTATKPSWVRNQVAAGPMRSMLPLISPTVR
jgi:uncharacterized repeat protein (TIGR01451 family)